MKYLLKRWFEILIICYFVVQLIILQNSIYVEYYIFLFLFLCAVFSFVIQFWGYNINPNFERLLRNNKKYEALYNQIFPFGRYSAFPQTLKFILSKKVKIDDKEIMVAKEKLRRWIIRFYIFLITQCIWIVILILLFKEHD